MALQKQSIQFNFAQGVDLKTDPNQVPVGKFLALSNAVFENGGGLLKRNGFGLLTTLPNSEQTSLATFKDSLLATGSSLYAFSAEANQWYNQGLIQPVDVNAQALVRTAESQTMCDAAVAPNSLVCTVYMQDGDAFYQIADSDNGQIIVTQVALGVDAEVPRAYVLGPYFVVTYLTLVGATPHLFYVAIPINNPTVPHAPVDVSAQVDTATTGYDAIVANDNLYIAWNASDVGGAIRFARINSNLLLTNTQIITGFNGDLISITADNTTPTPTLYTTWWDSVSTDGYTAVLDSMLTVMTAPVLSIATEDVVVLTSAAKNGTGYLFYEVENTYSFSVIRTDYIETNTVTQAGVVGVADIILRSVGLSSKAFNYIDDKIYMMAVYGQDLQPTNFLIDSEGNIISKLAYSNAGGYMDTQVLPNISINSNLIQIAYLLRTLLVPVNKTQGAASASGVFAQTGVNLASFFINNERQFNSEIATALHLTGGQLWMYDGVKPVEHGFHVWPEDLLVTTAGAGGSITAQQYFYVFCYEWTDAAGNLHRSAPSVPAEITTIGATSTNTINVPTLRLTYKTGVNEVRLVGYRWSTAQQVYYQFTSIQNPTINNTAVDSIAVTDTLADASILGNTILYTTGGVIENIGAPACSSITLFKSRLFIVDAEDRNLIWYSKQVVQGVPVEMSDLLTIFVAPTTGAQGSTGDIIALSAMDDKLIIFKEDAVYYVTGTGPDNTGANNDFSEPVYITGTVGCSNPDSIVLMPQGLMFQSDKGIWLLGRDLSSRYIGADVERYNGDLINSALCIPDTNQVRFGLDSGVMLMYDYYYGQWGTFDGVASISGVLQAQKHTFLNSLAQVCQETPDLFLDITKPVLLAFSTAWINLQGLQGFQRAYFFYFLSNFLTPHKLSIGIAYDYAPYTTQNVLISPDNQINIYGSDSLYGGSSPYGGGTGIEQWRVFLDRQKCQAIQLTMNEIYDMSKGIPAGAGLMMSGINMVIGAKAGYPKLPGAQSAS